MTSRHRSKVKGQQFPRPRSAMGTTTFNLQLSTFDSLNRADSPSAHSEGARYTFVRPRLLTEARPTETAQMISPARRPYAPTSLRVVSGGSAPCSPDGWGAVHGPAATATVTGSGSGSGSGSGRPFHTFHTSHTFHTGTGGESRISYLAPSLTFHACCSDNARAPEWRNGRRSGLKIRLGRPSGGSNPPSGTRFSGNPPIEHQLHGALVVQYRGVPPPQTVTMR